MSAKTATTLTVLFAILAIALITACGSVSHIVSEADVGAEEYITVRDAATGDVLFAYECAGTVADRVCELHELRAGLEVDAGALYDVPILGLVGARLNAFAEAGVGVSIRVEPVAGPIELDAFEWHHEAGEGSGQ